MEPNIAEALLGLIGVIIGALITNWFLRKKYNADAKKSASETEATEADANETIRKTVMGLIKPLQMQIIALEITIAKRDVTIAERDATIAKRDKTIADLEIWAERLVCQVKEAGKEPVKFIRHNRETKEQEK